MNNVKLRTISAALPATAVLLLGLLVLVLVAVHIRAARSDSRALNRECSEEASAFRNAADHLAGSKVIGYVPHYNQQRHQCLVKIASIQSEDHGAGTREQIFDPHDGSFVASCDRSVGIRPGRDKVIVMGAPVPVRQESAALAWFNDLMKK